MNLQAVFQDNMLRKGFTLIEVTLVVSLMLIVSIVSFPLGISFYNLQTLNETTDNVEQALKRAQTFATAGKHDSAFGVRLLENEYVIFEGDSYLTRVQSEDEVFPTLSSVTFSGLDEVVFSKLHGEPSSVGVVNMSLGGNEQQIEITSLGNIES